MYSITAGTAISVLSDRILGKDGSAIAFWVKEGAHLPAVILQKLLTKIALR